MKYNKKLKINKESLEFMNRCVDLSFDARFNLLLVLRKARSSYR